MITLALFLASAAAWIALELYYILSGQATISTQVRTLFRSYPPLGMLAGLAVGLLLAHFFWQ